MDLIYNHKLDRRARTNFMETMIKIRKNPPSKRLKTVVDQSTKRNSEIKPKDNIENVSDEMK